MIKLLLISIFIAAPTYAQTPAAELLKQVDFEQRLGGELPKHAALYENGQTTQLETLAAGKPVLFTMAYSSCPNLCDLVFQGIAEFLQASKLKSGHDFEVVILSFNPQDKAADLESKKKLIDMRAPGQPVHFVTASKETIDAFAQAIGLHYTFNAATQEYLHPAGLVVLTPELKISRYYFGIRYTTASLDDDLHAAQSGGIGKLAQKILLYCFHYDPRTGRYGLIISRAFQVAGGTTVVVLSLFIFWLQRRSKT